MTSHTGVGDGGEEISGPLHVLQNKLNSAFVLVTKTLLGEGGYRILAAIWSKQGYQNRMTYEERGGIVLVTKNYWGKGDV